MKAIRINEFGDHKVLKLISDLEIPKANEKEVLIKVHSVGVNPVDTYRRSGSYAVLPKLPWIPGSDCSGVVLDTGEDADKRFSQGQRVYTTFTNSGAYASHVIAPLAHVHHLPDTLTFEQGAALGVPYFTAYAAIFQRGRAESGETILIHGASGGVGIAAIQMAKARNLTVIGTAGTDDGLAIIKKAGADHVFNHRHKGYLTEIKEQFEGKINIIAEMLADKNLVHDCDLVSPRGRIMIIGNRGSIKFDPSLVMMKRIDIRGVALFSNSEEDWHVADLEISKWLQDGTISPVIGKLYDLADASQAHFDIINNSGATGKLVLNVNDTT